MIEAVVVLRDPARRLVALHADCVAAHVLSPSLGDDFLQEHPLRTVSDGRSGSHFGVY